MSGKTEPNEGEPIASLSLYHLKLKQCNNERVAVLEAWLDLQFLLSLWVTYKEDMFIKKVKGTTVIYRAHM